MVDRNSVLEIWKKIVSIKKIYFLSLHDHYYKLLAKVLNFDVFSAGQFEPLSLERRGFASGLRMASMPMGTVSEKLEI